MEIVTGTVRHIIFRNEDNGYTAFRLHSEKKPHYRRRNIFCYY